MRLGRRGNADVLEVPYVSVIASDAERSRRGRGDGRLRHRVRRMRVALLALALLLFGPCAMAGTEQYHAGVERITVSAAVPFDALVWYPTQATEVPWQAGPLPIPATRGAAVAAGRFPVVLLSHGGGVTGSSPLVLGELSSALARNGLIVVAPFHGKVGLAARPLQVRQALDAMLADPRFKLHADPARLGTLGFSLGGAVTLELAGAVPDIVHWVAYCRAHPSDVMSCDHSPDGRSVTATTQIPAMGRAARPSPLPVKAVVLLDPFGVPFQPDGLSAVTMPVLIFRPESSEFPGEGNAIGLAGALPHPPQYQTVPGGHFIFMDVCTPVMQSASPAACHDPAGVDRPTVHAGIEAKTAQFFHDHL
jgi:predicted dienelactone hydrolase